MTNTHGAYRHVPLSYYDSLADARKTLKENSLIGLELQMELREWLDRTAAKHAYSNFMQYYGLQKIQDEEQRQVLGLHLLENVKQVVGSASTYYVSPDMCELVKMAAEDMPASGLQPTDMPTDTGFLVFDRPIAMRSELPVEVNGEMVQTSTEVRIAAIAWQAGMVRQKPTGPGARPANSLEETVPGISYFLFNTPRDLAVGANLVATQVGEEPKNTEEEARSHLGPLPIFDFSGWAYNQPWRTTDQETRGYAVIEEGEQEPVAGVHSIVDQTRRLMLATWRILNQKNIVVLDPNRPPRHMRRRAGRVGVTEDGDIVIIRMRKEVFVGLRNTAGVEEGESWYSIRFPVRGHWHNYWMGPKGSQHLVPKYVAPYDKGPEGAPYVATRKIGSLER